MQVNELVEKLNTNCRYKDDDRRRVWEESDFDEEHKPLIDYCREFYYHPGGILCDDCSKILRKHKEKQMQQKSIQNILERLESIQAEVNELKNRMSDFKTEEN
jgi:hypothetical protein